MSLDSGRGGAPYHMTYYSKPPMDEMTLEEFEMWAIDRLRVLAEVESAAGRNLPLDAAKKAITERTKRYLPLQTEAERKKDEYSHYVLRLAFCRSEDLRARFIKAETTLFRTRWDDETVNERSAFIGSLNLGWQIVSSAEKEKLKSELIAASRIKDQTTFNTDSWYKIHWTKVTELVSQRKVLIRGGYAYVPSSLELAIVVAEFSSRLKSALELTAKALPRLDEDDRLLPILENLSMGFMAGYTSDYTTPTDGEAITAEMVPELSKISFPYCMRSLQDALKANHHLKHEGRQQLNLFLKGVGLSVEEALIFWRKSFSTMTDDKFRKDYQYNIRHNYGLEGSRVPYSPKSCIRIITGTAPVASQAHGCPFKHFDESHLKANLLTTYNLKTGEISDIVSQVAGGHYHLACTKLFEINHKALGVVAGDGVGKGDSVDHPNRYFEASRALMKESKERAGREAGEGSDTTENEKMEYD